MVDNFIACDTCNARLPANKGTFPFITISGHSDAFTCKDCIKQIEELQEELVKQNESTVRRIYSRIRFWGQ